MELEFPIGQLGALLIRLEQSGGDGEKALDHIGLDSTALDPPFKPYPLKLFGNLNDHCEQWSGNSLFSLLAGLYIDQKEFAGVEYALYTQPTGRDLLKMFIQISENVVSPVSFFLDANGKGGEFQIRVTAQLDSVLQVYLEFCIGLVVNVLRTGIGVPVIPSKVNIGHVPRAEPKEYEEILGREVNFNAGRYSLLIARETLDMPLLHPDQDLGNFALGALLERMEKFHNGSREIPDIVLITLHQVEDHDGWDLASIAGKLKTPKRTLQYQLGKSGTSFQLLVDMVRKDKAGTLIEAGQTQEDIASRLGYADVSSLRKAFHRWYGSPPGVWSKRP